MTPANRPMTALEWGLLVLLSVLWGGAFFFVGVAVRELPTLTIVMARVGLAALILLVVLGALGTRLRWTPSLLAAFLGMGLLNNVVPFSLIVWGQGQIASGVASILNAMTPLFAVIVAHLLTPDEKLSPRRVAGVLFGVGGVAVLVGGDALRTLGADLEAQAACLGAALSYAFAGIYGRRFGRLGVTPLQTAAGQLIASTLVLLPIWLVVDRPWTLVAPSAGTILALLGLASLATALAYVLFFRILATAGATNLLLVTLLIPASAILLGWAFLGEVVRPVHVLGMALIAAGLAVIDGRMLRSFGAVSGGRSHGRSTP